MSAISVPPVERVAAVILAAGEARRFGGAKLLAPLDGIPLLQHVVDAANASSATDVVIVVGHRRDELLAAIRPGRARAVVNEEYAKGQSTSLRVGIAQAGDADAVVVLLGDQPRVTSRLIDALVARQRETRAVAVVSVSGGRRSPPTLLHRLLWGAIGQLEGDIGAREVLAGRDGVAELDTSTTDGALDDVDEPGDLGRIGGRGASDRENA